MNAIRSFAVGWLVLLLFSCGNDLNAEIRSGNSVTIAVDEVIDDDVYIFAQTIVVDGTIKGDVIAFGQQIWVNGVVEGDLIAAGQQITLNGKLLDDTRVAGQVLTVAESASIEDDLVAAGFSLTGAKGSFIGGETSFAGYESTLAGDYQNAVSLAVTRCDLSGNFANDVTAIVDQSQPASPGFWSGLPSKSSSGLTVLSSAVIAGDFRYQSPRDAEIDPEATIDGEVEYTRTKSADAESVTLTGRFIDVAKQFLAMLVIGSLVIFACPKWTDAVVNNVQSRPLASLCWGVVSIISFVVVLIFLIVAIVCCAVLLGYVFLENLLPAWLAISILTFGGVLVGFMVFTSWISKVIVSAWVGNRIVSGQRWNSKSSLYSLAIGTLIYCLLTMIPVFGPVLSLVVCVIGLGSAALWMMGMSKTPLAKGKLA